MGEQLDQEAWRARRAAHEARIDRWTLPFLDRRSRGVTDPVGDFLFTYYSHRPAALRRWHPGIGVELLGDVEEFRGRVGYAIRGKSAAVNPSCALERLPRIRWIRDLLEATRGRAPHLGCFGLHEWAMVYREAPGELRHSSYPLRLGVAGTAQVVESHRIRCTHFDAFRFFTAAARPLNVVQPSREDQQLNDQPGCLHATMDCYKWAYSLNPFAPSELVADAFELAQEVRETDMRAAPYDLSELGIEPLPIETAAGKACYLAEQERFAESGAQLRGRLIEVCEAVLALTTTGT